MTVTNVNTSTYISDTTILVRDDLLSNITDPLSSTRPTNEKFVLTAYPQRQAIYPLITVKLRNTSTGKRLGMQSTLHWINQVLEVRVWARNVRERDELAQQVINRLRSVDLSKFVPAGLYTFEQTSATNVDDPGDQGIKSKVIEFKYNFVLGS